MVEIRLLWHILGMFFRSACYFSIPCRNRQTLLLAFSVYQLPRSELSGFPRRTFMKANRVTLITVPGNVPVCIVNSEHPCRGIMRAKIFEFLVFETLSYGTASLSIPFLFWVAFLPSFVYHRTFMLNVILSCRIVFLLASIFLFIGCSHLPGPFMENKGGEQSEPPSQLKDASEMASSDPVPVPRSEQNHSQAKKDNNDDEQAILDTALELTDTAQEYRDDGDMDHAIESLDQAYALILKIPGNNQKLSQQKEDLRFLISKRIIELYVSQKNAVKGSYDAIPMTLNEHVEREILSFQTAERDFFLESYKRSGRYRGEIVKALTQAGIPEELSWLPLIESGFKVRALSRSRAFGLWQFIPSTGYKFGLKRSVWIDERLDPAKSTAAAIAYFDELHQMFGDWATVLAAYNCGEGSVARAIRSQKIDYLDNFWDLYERLPRETARYFPRFLAVLAIVKDPARYGFTLEEPDKPLLYETVTVEKPIHMKTIAEKLDVDVEDLIALNPELRYSATPNTAYALKVPLGKSALLSDSLATLAKWSPPKVEYVFHRVRRGETLSLIALRYRTSIQRIIEANNLRQGRILRVGQRLKIPMKNASS